MRALSVLAGLLLAAICLAGLRIDILNNWEYGLTVSHELAGVLAVAAIGVAVLPAVAGLRGWNALYALGTAGCITLTVMAAFLAYTGKQGEIAAARQAAAESYQSAKRDEDSARREEAAARAEAAAITEAATVDELQLLVEAAKSKADREAGRGGCLGKCEAANDAYAAFVGRLGQAKAKAAALTRAETARRRIAHAQGRAEAGPAPVPMSAQWIAARTGRDAAQIAQTIDIGFALLSILVTQIFALLGHPAAKLIAWGVERPERITAAAAAAAASNPVVTMMLEPGTNFLAAAEIGTTPRSPAKTRRQRANRKAPAGTVDEVQTWTTDTLIGRAGATLPAGDAYAAFIESTGSQLSQAAFGAAMVDIGFSKAKKGGKVLYTGVTFKPALRVATG
jgi:hypothetical protein